MVNMDFWHKIKKQALIRKSRALSKQVPRTLARACTKSSDFAHRPPVIANSFPKSGTNLLLQILEVLPGVSSYGSVIASMPTLSYKERTQQVHLRLINRIVPGELVFAHLLYDPSYHEALLNRCCSHFFIYRDLRDVAISEAHYLTYMNRWHRMHNYFAKSLSNMEERISIAILGVSDPNLPYDYPNIGHRFARYQDWLKQSDVFTVKFEDLASERRNETLRSIATFFTERSDVKQSIDRKSEERIPRQI